MRKIALKNWGQKMSENKAHAIALLKDKLFVETMDRIENAAIEAALNAPRQDDQARRDAIIKANCIRDIRRDLQRLAADDNPIPRRA